LIPGEASWIAVFSNDSTAWGSFTYDPKDDALRVAVKPVTNDMHETFTYEFYPVGPDSAVLNLMWEKISVPLKIVVDVKPIALASIRRQLNTLAQYTAMAWDDAARYMLDNEWELQEAMSYVDTSIRKEENFGNMLTKAELLQKLGKTEESVQYWERAIKNTEPIQVHMYARQLQAQGQQEQAFRVFELNAKTHPEVWIVHAGLARVYSARSDFAKALKEMRVAAEHAPEKQKASLQKQIQQLEVNEDINQ
jgi:tetratricopeptide (TPR) repeat protein